MDAKEIQKKFELRLSSKGDEVGFLVKAWCIEGKKVSKHNKILELSGIVNCLVFLHIIGGKSHEWGVNENSLKKLEDSNKYWIDAFLFESENTGYLLTLTETKYYKDNVWTQGKNKNNENEYKVHENIFTDNNSYKFLIFDEFIEKLVELYKLYESKNSKNKKLAESVFQNGSSTIID